MVKAQGKRKPRRTDPRSPAGRPDTVIMDCPDIPEDAISTIQRVSDDVSVRRLSIPPSTILRPLLEHGPLPVQPVKVEWNNATKKHERNDASLRRSPRVKKEATNVGMLRSLFHGRRTGGGEETASCGL